MIDARCGSLWITLLVLALSGPASAEQRFGSIGILVAQLYDSEAQGNLGNLVVIGVLPGSSAAQSGLSTGDIITQIEGRPTRGKQMLDIVSNELRGGVNTSVLVTIVRYPETTFDVELLRATLQQSGGGGGPR